MENDRNKSPDTIVSEDIQEDSEEDANSDITSVTQQNASIPTKSPITRSSSNLTIENLRLHEESIIREDSLKGSSQSGRGTPLEVLLTGSPLVPVRTQSRQTSAGQKPQKNDVEPPNVPGESLRIGSGKPLPPIGVEKGEEVTEDKNGNSEDDSTPDESRGGSSGGRLRSSHPSILQRPHRKELIDREDLDRETVFSSKSVRSMTSRSERSVSFKEVNNGLGDDMNNVAGRPAVISPAVREVHRNVVAGKETVSVSIATETEWSWLESLKMAGLEDGKPLTPTSSHSQQKKVLRKVSTPSHDSNFSNMSGKMGEDSEEEEDETDREEGELKTRVPPLEIDGDPDDADAEVADPDNLIPSIGPPRIIQYQRETDRPYPNQNMMLSEADEDDDDLGPIPGISDTSLHLPEIQEEGAVCEYCHGEVKHFPTPEMRDNFSSEELYCCEDYQKFVEYAITNTPLSAQPSDELIDIAPHAPYGSKQARRAAKERAAARMREREIARQRAAGANQANFYAFARQMKTINFSLSSQKCMDEGWTLRPETPDDSPPPPLAYEPVKSTTPPLARSFKGENQIPIMERFFPSGQRFMVMFEDGSGTVFYSSGNPALHIVKVEPGQYLYITQDEPEKGTKRGQLLALFEPQGRGTCYHKNGNIRLNMDQNEGSFADSKGALKKRWHWWDHTTHVHAPPFQPICFALNSVLSVRCLAQDQIYLGFSQNKMNLRFNVGVKLKLVAPENIPEAEIDEDALYIADVRAYVQLVMDRISNQLHFSKSPKLGDIQPPRKLRNDFIRNDRKKQENCRRKATGKDMPVVTVN